MSELSIINNNDILIVCFGGFALQIGGITPFEFLNYLSSIYINKVDLLFYVDKYQCWYHKGIESITNNVDDTVIYLNNKINSGQYKKIIFMGVSAGGYASILFGSLCNNVDYVVSFLPQTILKNPIDINYVDLKNILNSQTKYILYGDPNITNVNNIHNIYHCENIEKNSNVTVVKKK